MAFSIEAVLVQLFVKFQPDLSIRRDLTPTESSCFKTLEAILVQTAENHAVHVTSDEEENCSSNELQVVPSYETDDAD